MTFDDFVYQIKRHEGYRGHVYIDTVGVPTGGWGHAFIEGSPIPVEVAERLLWHDLHRVEIDFQSLSLGLDGELARAYVIKNMLFNLGKSRLMGFKRFLDAVRSKKWDKAAFEMLDSKWARQVGIRARELAVQMRTGEYANPS